MSETLAVKYRPRVFNDVCEQSYTVDILKKQLETNNVKNTYIFSGSSGCGKTTVARIFANYINKGNGNPIEIDAASNNSVDNVRQIVKSASERSLDSEYKVYIIDECHMLTIQAWNAFLKCIEEPPEYTVFIFCTTDIQKVPPTILNRCMRLTFSRLTPEGIESRLNAICEAEGLINYQDSTNYISRICEGQMRDAISFLEKCLDYSSTMDIENTKKILGDFSYDNYFKLLDGILGGKENQVIAVLEDIYSTSTNIELFVAQFLKFCFDLHKYILFGFCNIPKTFSEEITKVTNFDSSSIYYSVIEDKLVDLMEKLKNSMSIKELVEISFLRMTRWQ